MRPFVALVFALAAAGLAACSEPPFVDVTPQGLAELKSGSSISICHAVEHKRPQIDALAEQTCREHDLHAEFTGRARFSCRLLAPQRSTYICR